MPFDEHKERMSINVDTLITGLLLTAVNAATGFLTQHSLKRFLERWEKKSKDQKQEQ
jgi:hypothetical protein